MKLRRLLAFLIGVVVVGGAIMALAEDKTMRLARELLNHDYNLKQRYSKGQKRHYRLWMTLEVLGPAGDVTFRNQWRGDFERLVLAVDSTGRADEQVTWKNVGWRMWDPSGNHYGKPEVFASASGYTYRFSAESSYDELKWDLSPLAQSPLSSAFQGGLQVSAHYEFDFMRSSRHAAIEKLRRPGDVLRHTPEEGQAFSLDFPPYMTDSHFHREHVVVGFRGLTLCSGEPSAIIDYHQGPQDFTWMSNVTSVTTGAQSSKAHTQLKSWQDGEFLVRLQDASLLQGEFMEHHIMQVTPEGGGPTSLASRGIWSIREITPADYSNGLSDWDGDQSPSPILRPDVSR